MTQVVNTVHVSTEFRKSFKKLPKIIKDLAIEQDLLFRKNVLNVKLEVHALAGPLEGYHVYSVNKDYRIPFRFITPHEVMYFDIGTHSVYCL